MIIITTLRKTIVEPINAPKSCAPSATLGLAYDKFCQYILSFSNVLP